MRQYFSYVITGILSVIAVVINDEIKEALSGPWAIGITVLILAVIISLWGVIDAYWVNFKFLRKFSRKHSIEGYWIEILFPCKTPISYAVIEFTDGQFKYYGSNYDLDIRLAATFEGRDIEVTQVGRKLRFYYDGKLLIEGIKEVQGKGEITFFSNGDNKYNRGEGYFMESDNEGAVTQIHMNLYKIEPAIVKKVYGSEKVFKGANYKLVEHYLKLDWFKKQLDDLKDNTTDRGVATNSSATA